MSSNINPNNIDTTYPVAGQDNDSQGFRGQAGRVRPAQVPRPRARRAQEHDHREEQDRPRLGWQGQRDLCVSHRRQERFPQGKAKQRTETWH